MNIKEAQYYKSAMPNSPTYIKVTESNGKVLHVPQNSANRHYAEIMRQVKEEGLTIKDAE